MAQRGERETRRQNLQSSSTGILTWRQQPRRRRRRLFAWRCSTRTLTAQERQQLKQPGESCVPIPPLLNPSSLIPPPPLFPPPPPPPPNPTGSVVLLNVLRCQLTLKGQAEINVPARFSKSLRPWKPEGSLGRTAQDGYLDSHTAPELCATPPPQSLK